MSVEYSRKYLVANLVCHFLHIGIIGFVAVGWLFPSLRTLHLILISSTLVCWFVLGLHFGFGYCPITDWHWKLKDKWGEGRPSTSYIHSGLQRVLGKTLNPSRVDSVVLGGTLLIAVVAAFRYFST